MGAQKRKIVWMHASSLGEFEQGRPVLEHLRTLYPGYSYIITFFSPSGYDVAKNYKGADHIFYLPFDSPAHARQLLDLFNPSLVLWIKYDYWYYYLNEIQKRGIPVLLLSGIFRRDQAFFKWYGKINRRMLRCITHFFVQTEQSQELLQSIDINQVSVGGDTRFDRVIEIAESTTAVPVPGIDAFCNNAPVLVAGSTWQEDDEELDHFANTHPELKFIVAPHDIDESRLQEVEKLYKNSVRYSEWERLLQAHPDTSGYRPGSSHAQTPNVLIIDNIGLLSRLYRYATITWVGGGFGDDGVHNVLEAAVYGKPVVFGPVYDKYIEAIELVGSGGGFSVENALEAENLFNSLLSNKDEYEEACQASRDYVYAKKGATEKILAYIQENRLLTN
jgi:3-deoxy-D-manno-octulosonic-acid transferase